MFKRKIIERLKEWKNKRQGRTAVMEREELTQLVR